MESQASDVVRKQNDGRYMVVASRLKWAERKIPNFATEAEANAWNAGLRKFIR